MNAAQSARNAECPLLGCHYTLETPRIRALTPVQRHVRDKILASDHVGDYESVPCLCGTEEAILLSQVERHGLPYRKVACGNCGLLRVTPRWTADRYARFYEHEYRDLYLPVLDSKEQHARKLSLSPWFRELADWVIGAHKRFGVPGFPRIVEIGSGGGWNLGLLPSTWDRIGFDVDREYLSIGERLFGCTMRFGVAADALPDVRTADVVLLSHVLEHFSNPVEELTRIGAAMNETALLLIEVPGIFRLHRTNIDPMSYMQNAHTYTFCAGTLRNVCVRSGLEVLQIDENVRAICRRAARGSLGSGPMENPHLARRIVNYLRRCESGYRVILHSHRVPVIGRYLSGMLRRILRLV